MRVLLVNMPFGSIRPAIGPSLLKAHLQTINCEATVAYLNLRFAGLLGSADFTYIADRSPTQSLVGEWIFAPSLFGPRPAADRDYLKAFEDRFGIYAPTGDNIPALHRARQIAETFIDECLREVKWDSFDVIGFTSTFTQNVASLALARRLKDRYPDKTIIFGGANCEDRMGLALHRSFPFVDYVCSGEADISFPRLITALRDGGDPAQIPGVIARSGGESVYISLSPERIRDLNTLPYPVYDDYFDQHPRGNSKGSGILMESSRGCWWGEKHHCTFCGLNGTSMAFRSKTADRVLDEITEQIRRYHPEHVEMVDNILDMGYFHDLLPELKRRGLKLGLFYETKSNLTKQQVRDLWEAGVSSIQPGIESFSTGVLRIMRKGTTGLQNIQLLKWCKEIGMRAYWNLLYGFPGEDPEDYRQMADMIDSLTHLDAPEGMGAIRLDRFSPNFTAAAELGLCNVRPDRSYSYIYDLPAEELADLAYYFEHDYSDGSDPSEYVAGTEAATRRWLGAPGGRGLVFVDHGDQLAIWDFRPSAQQRLAVLDGNERALYLYCDAHRSAKAVTAFAAKQGMTEHECTATIERFVKARTMITLDGRFLSLAVQHNAESMRHDPAKQQAPIAF